MDQSKDKPEVKKSEPDRFIYLVMYCSIGGTEQPIEAYLERQKADDKVTQLLKTRGIYYVKPLKLNE